MGKRLFIALGALLIVGVVGIYVFEQIRSAPLAQTSQKTESPFVRTLLNSNPSFAAAEAQLKAGNEAEALSLYGQAFTAATTAADRGLIEDRSARSLVQSGDYLSAIPIFLKIANTPEYLPILRAYALKEIVAMFSTYQDPKISVIVFSEEPYKSFARNVPNWKPYSAAYKNLALYSEQFYPTAQAALDVALWDAAGIAYLKKAGPLSATSTVAVNKALTEIPEQISLIQGDLPRLQNSPSDGIELPMIYRHEADLAAQLEAVGATSTALGDPEALYQEAISAANASLASGFTDYVDTQKSFIYYGYALYLAMTYGASRTAQVQSLLSNFYASPTPLPVSVTAFFTSPSAMATGGEARGQIETLSSFDPKFSAYVKNLGWH